MNLPPLLLAIAALFGAAVVALHWHRGRRQRVMTRLLDAADALESHLRQAQAQFGADGGGDANPVREALLQMLRQRLWLQQHGAGASVAELESIRGSIAEADDRIRRELARLGDARADASA